jgi:hypothetical protein
MLKGRSMICFSLAFVFAVVFRALVLVIMFNENLNHEWIQIASGLNFIMYILLTIGIYGLFATVRGYIGGVK